MRKLFAHIHYKHDSVFYRMQDEQSVFSSVSHCHSSDTEYKPYKSLENNFQEKHEGNNIALKEHQLDKKLTTFQEEVASAVHVSISNQDNFLSDKKA